MKKLFNSIPLLILLFLLSSCKFNGKEYIKNVLTNLDKVNSATYNNYIESFAPGAKSPTFTSLRFYKEFINSNDTTIGSSFVVFLQKDTNRMTFCYDGKMRATVYNEENLLSIDSFKFSQLPFRPIAPPFFNYSKSILKYALETKDSITQNFDVFKDSVIIKLVIHSDKQVEFFGRPYSMDDPYSSGREVSQYTLWINKNNNLPYRIKREMSHDISVSTISNTQLNTEKLESFNAEKYFPKDLAVVEYGVHRSTEKNYLQGKKALGWTLKDLANNEVALNKLNSKIIMIQFTSISCGPCKASIPFLKQLSSEFQKKDFDLISVESWCRSADALIAYQNRNKINYKFLMSTDKILKDYNVRAVPTFYILDKNRVIKKIITGYSESITDNEIRKVIRELK